MGKISGEARQVFTFLPGTKPCPAPLAAIGSPEALCIPKLSSSSGLTMRGIKYSRSFNRAIYSELPPRIMSVPRPAMLVAIVTAPLRPAWAIISASRSTFSGLALSNSWGISISLRSRLRSSDFSTLVVPTNTGLPFSCISAHSLAIAPHFPGSVLNTISDKSSRLLIRLVGIIVTSRL